MDLYKISIILFFFIILIIILMILFIYKIYKILENKTQTKESNITNPTIESSEIKAELEKLNQEKQKISTDINELNSQKSALQKELEKLKEETKNIQSYLQEKLKEKENINQEINKILEKARQEADELTKKAFEKLDNVSKEWENIQKQKQELWEKEKQISLIQKELEIKKQALIEEKEKITQIEQEIKQKQEEIEKIKESVEIELKKIANLTPEQAKEILLKKVEDQIKSELINTIMKIEQEYIKSAEQKAKRILISTLNRITSDSVAENTTYSIVLPSEEYKGRVIGKEGRNIKAFEEITGVDLIIDDSSEVVFVSSFDPIRREKARLTLEKLLSIGKINPIAIQEVYDQVEKEINIKIQEEGENACLQAKIFDLHPDLVSIVGKMKYRASYGQNLLKHSIQVSSIAAILAAEVGANVEICRRAAFLHDIGKVLEESNGEPHAIAGAKIAKIYGEKEEVVRAIASHHNEVPQETIEDIIVQIADSISASRPGARKETFHLYIQRLQKLEEVAMSFPGVEKAFVLQGGKEVIVFVKHEMVNDQEVYNLAKEISKAIENNLKYPGVIRVTVIRKVIAVQIAR
ncbi:MAG: ribonuclease Y [bacterium]|nr:ribonuclease Y [bacterium]